MGSPGGHVLSGKLTLTAEARTFLEELGFGPVKKDDVWVEALTHGSTGDPRDYQRLEFLGDRVLGLVIADWLHERESHAEGKLSQRLNALVSRQMCASVARRIGLPDHIRLGSQARADGGADSDNILGDVMEALLGAGFVEHGFDAMRVLVRKLWSHAVKGEVGQSKHPKSALQEWAAGSGRRMPEYTLVDRQGPDHAARFTVEVSVKGVGAAQATASSKGEAEKQAAKEFMEKFA
ncbi:ribonuclease III [Erythrobacter sp. SG61-1L]|nr:ribonuclease III [Erythrobacter sp. SG61-1L]